MGCDTSGPTRHTSVLDAQEVLYAELHSHDVGHCRINPGLYVPEFGSWRFLKTFEAKTTVEPDRLQRLHLAQMFSSSSTSFHFSTRKPLGSEAGWLSGHLCCALLGNQQHLRAACPWYFVPLWKFPNSCIICFKNEITPVDELLGFPVNKASCNSYKAKTVMCNNILQCLRFQSVGSLNGFHWRAAKFSKRTWFCYDCGKLSSYTCFPHFTPHFEAFSICWILQWCCKNPSVTVFQCRSESVFSCWVCYP